MTDTADVIIHLVRHAHAGDRAAWSGPDALRPLTTKGWRQAEWIADVLADESITSLRTSPALRCAQALQPLAARTRRSLVHDAALFEECMFTLPRARGTYVLCAHGDNLADVLARCDLDAEQCAKGSVWTLHMSGGVVKNATYRAPPKT